MKRLVVPAFCAPMMVNRGKHFRTPKSLSSTGDGHRGPLWANSKEGLCTWEHHHGDTTVGAHVKNTLAKKTRLFG